MNIEFSSVAEKDLRDACETHRKERLEGNESIYKCGSTCSCLLVAAAES
jgi:hypothetical protein